jgi:hypothetical protein
VGGFVDLKEKNMSSVIISGDTSGAITVSAPAVSGTNTLTLLAATATNSVNTLATAVASTSGTSIDFTGLPSWVKRITLMFQGVSTNGTSNWLFQLGSGSATTSGYLGTGYRATNAGSWINIAFTTGFGVPFDTASAVVHGSIVFANITGNNWVANGFLSRSDTTTTGGTGGSISLAGVLDRVRITTVGGTDTFDAGTINILYEG